VVDRASPGSAHGKPFFLWVHVFDPHLPYDPPSPFREKYKGRPYDGEVAYTDQQLGRLFDAVAKKSPQENTLIAVLSDHGESFSEHGEYAHGVFIYDTRHAFLLAGPAFRQPCAQRQARTIDLLPPSGTDGGAPLPRSASLRPALAGEKFHRHSYAETLFQAQHGLTELRGSPTGEVHPRPGAI
jgi:arylsulfatase A-like enzyme